MALACGLILTSTSLFAQKKPRVPISRPSSIGSQAPSIPKGPLPPAVTQLPRLAGVNIGQSYDGISFSQSNCGCYPPDTNAAVGGNFVVHAVNVQLRIYDKTTGTVLLDEPLSNFFGATTQGDPYVVYDELADRWYINAFDSDASGLFLAVSQTNDPTGAWYVYDLTNVGGFPDFAKPGYNKDAIFISYNDFGSAGGYAAVAAINKAQALAGIYPAYYTSYPPPQFRAIPPARMHGDFTGGTEWFLSIDYSGGNSVRVTKMTNYFSNSPNYTTWQVPVQPFGYFVNADQPGAPGSVTDNDPTATAVQYHNKRLVTATEASIAADGFTYPKGHYYQIDVSTGTPRLMTDGLIDPGPGVSVYMVSADRDNAGNFGATWMESSLSEYVSMWVGTRPNVFPNNWINAAQVAPGVFMPYSGRTGDYSSTVLDSDGMTFWSANEYSGSDIWNTHITSFKK